jgi:hypothetical protein
MLIRKLNEIFYLLSIVLISIVSAGRKCLNLEQVGRIDALFKRAIRYGFTSFFSTFGTLAMC